MKPQLQSYKHDPANGVYGDCHRTAIACILHMDKELIPNFGEHYDDHAAFKKAEEDFLRSVGLATVEIPFSASMDEVLMVMGHLNPGVYYLFSGKSKRGFNHTTVGLGNKIVWDPAHGEEHSIIGPCDSPEGQGYYWVTVLVPIEHTSKWEPKDG